MLSAKPTLNNDSDQLADNLDNLIVGALATHILSSKDSMELRTGPYDEFCQGQMIHKASNTSGVVSLTRLALSC